MPHSDTYSFLHYIDYWADQTPHSPAWSLATQDLQFHAISWEKLRLQVLGTISHLSQLDLPIQSRIITCDRNSLQWVIVDLACQALNWIHVPIDTRLSDSTKRSICNRLNPALLAVLENDQAFAFLNETSYPMWKHTQGSNTSNYDWSYPTPDSIATILFTSGSTAAPKGVQLTHQNLLANARAKLDAMPQHASDRRLNLLPFSHAYARTCELSTWIVSGSSMMTVSTIDNLFEIAPHFEPTLINGVPYMFERIRKHVLENKLMHRSEVVGQADSDSNRQLLHLALGTQLRMIAAGGAGLDESTFDWFAQCGYSIYQGYGLTEAGPVVCSNRFANLSSIDEPSSKDSPSSKDVGFPVAQTTVRIDSNQRLFVKGPGVMVGYEGDAEATREKICDGWLDTGDLAEWTTKGTVRILGRSDDRITLTTGYKIDPSPIERKICKVLGVDHCVLTLSSLQRLLLIVPCSKFEGREPADMLQYIRESIVDEPSYALPSKVMIVEDDWSEANGMLNAKGALQRARVHDRYLGGIK